MIRIRIRRVALALAAYALMGLASAVEAQRFPVIAGGDVRVGAVWPQNGTRGIGAGADLDLGAFLPGIRVIAGLQGFNADLNPMVGGQRITGDLAARGGRFGARFTPLGPGTFAPYVTGSVVAYNLSADADVPERQAELRRLYSGTVLGTGIGAGVVYPLEPTQQLMAVLEGRREWVGNVDHWALEVGARVRLRAPDPRFPRR